MKQRASSKAAAKTRREARKNRSTKANRPKAPASSGRRASAASKPDRTIAKYRRELKMQLEAEPAPEEPDAQEPPLETDFPSP